jgi:predicted O-linked N-acetylglucosamine transferase (SPINDLY family)
LGQLGEAEAVARQACALEPPNAVAYDTLANVLLVRGDLEGAIATLEEGCSRTGAGHLLGQLTYQLRQACDWSRWQVAWDRLAPEIERDAALGSPFWLLCEPTSAEQQLDYTRRWAAARFRSAASGVGAPSAPAAHRRLRIGYLSSDLQEHAAAYLVTEVLELHDRERFEVFAYSHGPDDGGMMRQRVRAACEHFIDIAWEPDDVAAERIRSDALDVLVDLKGYTAGDRLTIMARRPCSVQVTWLGYPGTTGAAFMDYLIADPFIIPPGDERHYSERIVRMPHCYQSNDRKRAIGESLPRADYGLPDGAFVFCCFNQAYKITPDIFTVWMRLLKAIPNSVLWLVESHRLASQNLLASAQTHSVPAERLVFAPRMPYAQHLARYRMADLALDTFPYTSHTILSDALWCGCPTVGLCGTTFASRVSGSLLTAAGLPDLVTYTIADYERLALRIAGESRFMQEIRSRVAHARDHSALFDSTAFTRDLERLYVGLVGNLRA